MAPSSPGRSGGCAPRSRSLRLVALLGVWYISSLLTSLSTKEILRVFPYPISLAAVQQAIAASCGWVSLQTARPRLSVLRDRQLHLSTLPVAAVMVISLASYRWALMVGSVSFVHTVKTLGPVFTIAFARLLLGECLPPSRYLSVGPVVLGVALTSITEAEFTTIGFLAILLSTAAQALQAVIAKRLMREREVGKSELFALAALHAFAMLLPLSVVLDAWRIQQRPLSHAKALRLVRWLLMNGVCSYVNQYSGLSVLDAMSSPLSHALANVMKRATVITAAMVYQARPVTPLHMCGVALSVFGAVGYQHRDVCYAGARARPADADCSAPYELVPLQPKSGGRIDVEGKPSKDNSETTAGDDSNASSCGTSPSDSPPNSRPSSPQVQPRSGGGGSPRGRPGSHAHADPGPAV